MPKPNDSAPTVDHSFPHDWQATILDNRPLIAPARHYVYPAQVEEVERGALELLIRPKTPSSEAFLATFALGFADPAVPTGVYATPNRAQLCAVAGGYAYLLDTTNPTQWEQVEYRPVLQVTPLPQQNLLLFAGHHSLIAYGPEGKAWQTKKLSWEGIKVLQITSNTLTGLGWDLMTDREFEFKVNLQTGEHSQQT